MIFLELASHYPDFSLFGIKSKSETYLLEIQLQAFK
jgi:hypothetical protein